MVKALWVASQGADHCLEKRKLDPGVPMAVTGGVRAADQHQAVVRGHT
jgi:hypothetical protein